VWGYHALAQRLYDADINGCDLIDMYKGAMIDDFAPWTTRMPICSEDADTICDTICAACRYLADADFVLPEKDHWVCGCHVNSPHQNSTMQVKIKL
jgi:hypothetical protein